MCREVYESLPAARELFERAAEVLGYDLAAVCFEGPESRLHSTEVSQPALFVSGMVALEKLKETSPEVIEQCQAAAGLSLGEYTAITFAGGMSFEEGLRLVQRRGEAMQAASDQVDSGMVSILGLDPDAVQAVCDQARQEGEILQIANLLCPGNIVVSGHRAACDRVAPIAAEAGAIKTIPLTVAGAFHTALMEPAVAPLQQALQEVDFSATRIPVYSNVDASPHSDPESFRELLGRQVGSPVRWHESIEAMRAAGIETFYEVGYGRVLRGLIKRIHRKTPCHGVLD